MHFSDGKERVLQTIILRDKTVTDPQTCCQGMLVTPLGVLKPCYTVERAPGA